MTYNDVLLQQVINGVSLGAMYALLALGFTMVYGIIELINFAHFNIFMVGSFFAMWILKLTGLVGQRVILTGFPLLGVLLLALVCVMLFCGVSGRGDRAHHAATLAQRAGHGGDDHDDRRLLHPLQRHPAVAGGRALNFPNPMPNIVWKVAGADLHLREVLVWVIALLLMVGLHLFVRRTRMGKAMQATAQDQEAARMMGIEVDSVVPPRPAEASGRRTLRIDGVSQWQPRPIKRRSCSSAPGSASCRAVTGSDSASRPSTASSTVPLRVTLPTFNWPRSWGS